MTLRTQITETIQHTRIRQTKYISHRPNPVFRHSSNHYEKDFTIRFLRKAVLVLHPTANFRVHDRSVKIFMIIETLTLDLQSPCVRRYDRYYPIVFARSRARPLHRSRPDGIRRRRRRPLTLRPNRTRV